MALPALEDLTTALDRTCIDVLGDTIGYKAAGAGSYADLRAHVNYRDAARAFENAEVFAQDVTVTMLKVDVPVKPGSTVRLTFPKLAGSVFKPINVRTDDSGTGWEFDVQVVPS